MKNRYSFLLVFIFLFSLLSYAQDPSQMEKVMTAHDEVMTSMMNWMQGFGERFTADEMMKGKALSAEKKVWLEEEELKIEELRKEIDSSIEEAEKLLEK